jgi:Asp/Glu/hydantoin racemase
VEEETEVEQTLALIHTSPTLTPMFGELCSRYLPETSIFHMVDESLIGDTIREGRLRRVTMRRLLTMIESAAAAGADAVMVTCSSIGPGVKVAQQLFDIPVIRVDEAMAEEAVRMGRRIGVMATLRTTLEPTIALLREKAAEAGVEIEIVDSLADGAFDAVLTGDTATHDRVLSRALRDEMQGVDVIVLAQASMARVVKAMPKGSLQAPVLSSPELAVQRARAILTEVSGAMSEPVLAGASGRETSRKRAATASQSFPV